MRGAVSGDRAVPASLEGPATGVGSTRAYVRVRSFLVVVGPEIGAHLRSSSWAASPLCTGRSAGGQLEVGFVPESTTPHDPLRLDRGSVTLVLGDDAEFSTRPSECMAYSLSVEVDLVRGTVEVLTSIVGLPPVFMCRFRDKVVVTSDLSLLADFPEPLSIDPASAVDLIYTGYPTSHRTLFKDVSLVPGGHRVNVDASGTVSVTRCWSLPLSETPLDWPSYLDLQCQAFATTVRSLDISTSFLALTGGLDTRTIFAALVNEGRSLPAATLTGPSRSLDARIAGALCRAYGRSHHIVRLDGEFMRALPDYVVEASRITGGLASVGKAGEIHFYRQIAGVASRELSGNLGNQVGRQAFESVSARGASTSVLADGLAREREFQSPTKPIFNRSQTWHSAYQWFLQEEATLGQVGDFCVGQHFATQQTPYASRAMIETLGYSPVASQPVGSFSSSRARWRDLYHRFVGERKDRSFQRKLVAEVGGYVASCPINLGWRPRGGVSLSGLGMGLLAFADMTASSHLPASRLSGAILEMTGIRGLHETKMYRSWLNDGLKDFVHDTLRSQTTRQSGLFNVAELDRLLREHFTLGKDLHRTIIAALDLALAYRLFCTA
jgi:hypothetical protein